MNILLYQLAEGKVKPKPNAATKLVVEDNVGESIHIHIRNIRLEMSIGDFIDFSKQIEEAAEGLRNGDS